MRALVIAVTLLAAGCGRSVSTSDPRFATPERTVQTLFDAHGIGEASEAEVLRRMAAEGGLRVEDPAAFAACFADLDRPDGVALAGYVTGMLAAARDALRYETIEHRGYVIPREGVRVVLARGDDGAYRIVLAESVPEEVRRSLDL